MKRRDPTLGFARPSRARRAICASWAVSPTWVVALRLWAVGLSPAVPAWPARRTRGAPCRCTSRGRSAAARARRPVGARGVAVRRRPSGYEGGSRRSRRVVAVRSILGTSIRRGCPAPEALVTASRSRAPTRCRLLMSARQAARAQAQRVGGCQCALQLRSTPRVPTWLARRPAHVAACRWLGGLPRAGPCWPRRCTAPHSPISERKEQTLAAVRCLPPAEGPEPLRFRLPALPSGERDRAVRRDRAPDRLGNRLQLIEPARWLGPARRP